VGAHAFDVNDDEGAVKHIELPFFDEKNGKALLDRDRARRRQQFTHGFLLRRHRQQTQAKRLATTDARLDGFGESHRIGHPQAPS